jgi:hypothetical protein
VSSRSADNREAAPPKAQLGESVKENRRPDPRHHFFSSNHPVEVALDARGQRLSMGALDIPSAKRPRNDPASAPGVNSSVNAV